MAKVKGQAQPLSEDELRAAKLDSYIVINADEMKGVLEGLDENIKDLFCEATEMIGCGKVMGAVDRLSNVASEDTRKKVTGLISSYTKGGRDFANKMAKAENKKRTKDDEYKDKTRYEKTVKESKNKEEGMFDESEELGYSAMVLSRFNTDDD